jgi:flagellar hook-associated protein 2
MAPISISGLGSSLDTESIIANLMKIERAPRARLEQRQGQVKARETALRDVLAKLEAVSNAATSLRSAGLWADVQTVRSSAPGSVDAQRLAGAGPGGYQVEVSQLARAEQRTYAFTSSATPSQLTVGGQTIELAAGATLGDAAAAINANPATGVYAVEVGGRLVLSSRQTGAANSIAAGGAAIAEEAAKLRPGLDAAYSVDGVAGSSASNTVGDAIPGLELTLSAVTPAVAITVGNPGPDLDAVKSQLKTFVNAYNAAVDAIRGRVTEKRVPGASSQAEANQGVLFGDTALNGLLGQMRQVLSGSGLAALGIGTGAPSSTVSASSDSVLGHLAIDDAKLTAALQADPAAARAKIAGPGGLTDSLGGLLGPTLGSQGSISERLDAAASDAARIQASMAALDTRLEAREDRLRAQFAAMESALSRSKSQSEWLNGQLAGLGSG